MNSQSNEMATLLRSVHISVVIPTMKLFTNACFTFSTMLFLVALASLSARLFIMFLAGSIVAASTLPCLAPTLIKALIS